MCKLDNLKNMSNGLLLTILLAPAYNVWAMSDFISIPKKSKILFVYASVGDRKYFKKIYENSNINPQVISMDEGKLIYMGMDEYSYLYKYDVFGDYGNNTLMIKVLL